MEPRTDPPGVRLTPHLMFGLLIILVGVVFTLDNLNIAHAEDYLRYWPAGLIAIGLAKLWQDRREQGSSIGGVIFTLVGTWLLFDTLGYVEANPIDFWPLLLVFIGTVIVWQGIRGRRQRSGASTNDTINAVAILSGVNRGSNSTSFKGGELTAFMGGCEIDLRNAEINGEAAIDVFAMWGRHRDPRPGELDGDRQGHAVDGRFRGSHASTAGRERPPPHCPRHGDHGRCRDKE